jgi:hypothetical protein
MTLTDDHKVKIFCAALTAVIQAQATMITTKGPTSVRLGPIDTASNLAAESIAKLQSKDWA